MVYEKNVIDVEISATLRRLIPYTRFRVPRMFIPSSELVTLFVRDMTVVLAIRHLGSILTPSYMFLPTDSRTA